jgi:hypothetical protein
LSAVGGGQAPLDGRTEVRGGGMVGPWVHCNWSIYTESGMCNRSNTSQSGYSDGLRAMLMFLLSIGMSKVIWILKRIDGVENLICYRTSMQLVRIGKFNATSELYIYVYFDDNKQKEVA